MDLAMLSRHATSKREAIAVNDWQARVEGTCGFFQAERFEKRSTVTGYVGLVQGLGVEVAHVANDLANVRRGANDIRRDFGEHLFLLIQLEGTCGIEQKDRQSIIAPGDCALVDSSKPSVFHFGGNYSNHISVHLPRQLLFSKSCQSLEVARRLAAADPMSVMLSSLVAKLMEIDSHDKRVSPLQQLLFDATRQAFATQDEMAELPHSETAGDRYEIVQILIDQHLTDEQLTPRWLADKLGVSLRTLQEDFSSFGTTPTSMIRLRRLNLAKEHLLMRKNQGAKANIAEVAFSAGFNDISYFNRCFREVFKCTPKDMLNGGPT